MQIPDSIPNRRGSMLRHSLWGFLVIGLFFVPGTGGALQADDTKKAGPEKPPLQAKSLGELGKSLHLDLGGEDKKGLVIDNEKLQELGAGVRLSQGGSLIAPKAEGEESLAPGAPPPPRKSTPEELSAVTSNLSDEEIRQAVSGMRHNEADLRLKLTKAAPAEQKKLRKRITNLQARRRDMETVIAERRRAVEKAGSESPEQH